MKKKLTGKYKFLVKNTILFTIANFSNKLIVFLLLPFYTIFLSPAEYAIIDVISITQQLIFPIFTLDITEAITRFGMEKENNKKNIFIIGLFFILFGNIILGVGCYSAIALSIGVEKYIIYFFLFNLVISFNTLYSSFLKTIDKVNLITLASIVNTFLTTSLNIFLIARMKMGIEGYYLSFIGGNFISILIMLYGSKTKFFTSNFDKTKIKELTKNMVKYSLPLIPNALFWWVNSSLDRFFLTALSGLTYVGIYAAANKIPSILNTFTSIVQQAWGLSLFKEQESFSKKAFFNNVYKFYNELIFLASIILIFCAKKLCYILLSNEFFEAWNCVPILILGFYFNAISSFIGTEFTASKKTSWILITTIISALVNILLNILLIPKFSCVGAAIATCISYLILLEARIITINRKFEISINNRDILIKGLLMCFMIISVLFFNSKINLMIFAIIMSISLIINLEYYKKVFSLGKSIITRKGRIKNEKSCR